MPPGGGGGAGRGPARGRARGARGSGGRFLKRIACAAAGAAAGGAAAARRASAHAAKNEAMTLARRGVGSLQQLRRKGDRESRERESESEWLRQSRAQRGSGAGAAGPLRLSVLKITPDGAAPLHARAPARAPAAAQGRPLTRACSAPAAAGPPTGRCMFRALVQGASAPSRPRAPAPPRPAAPDRLAAPPGMAQNRVNDVLTHGDETREADALRLAVNEALCGGRQRRREYMNAARGAKAEYGSLDRFCNVSRRPTHWGGEVEMLVVSRMLRQPIIVYRPLAVRAPTLVPAAHRAPRLRPRARPDA